MEVFYYKISNLNFVTKFSSLPNPVLNFLVMISLIFSAATAKHKEYAFVAARAAEALKDCRAQEFTNTVWAGATLRSPLPILSSAHEHLPRLIPQLKEQHIANLIWAFSVCQNQVGST